jgi:kynurenine formamidase
MSLVSERELPSEDTVLSWFDDLSNWDRWGSDDRLGTLNLITPSKRVAAAREVQMGIAVSCAWDIEMNRMDGFRMPPQRWMARVPLGWDVRDTESAAARSKDGSMNTASESISIVYHGLAITHIDALSHVHWRGQMYGGKASSHVTDIDGATVHDIRAAAAGIITRGVLLDLPRLMGVDALLPGEPIFPSDLDAALKAEGVEVEPGDALLIRTGDGLRRRSGSWAPERDGQPGLHAACLPWLRAHDVAALGADVPQDVRPSGYRAISLPIHAIGVVAMGLCLIDNCQLDVLAAKCAEVGAWSFQLSIGAIPFVGVTGSPVNPIAVL